MKINESQKSQLMGKTSYPVVVAEIIEKIQKAEASTLSGTELLKSVYARLNESITPIMELRAFTTGAEKIAGDDVKLKDILSFITKKVTTNGDLNFLINLCKEEHFSELTRLNHPSPESTVKNIEDEFDKPASVIEEGIRSGLFDGLKSKLLNKIKVDLTIEPDKKKLNENNAMFSGNLIKYSPIGIKLEDLERNKIVILTESVVLEMDRLTKNLSVMNESEILIPEGHAHLMNAINSAAYYPTDNTFGLNESWDFDLRLQPSGKVTINNNEIPTEKVKDLLLESVRAYVSDPTKVTNFGKMEFLRDADNFITLMENANKLIRIDSLEVIKNLNENSSVMFDRKSISENKAPIMLFATKGEKNKLFESYTEFVSDINGSLLGNVSNLFESQLVQEQEKIQQKAQKIQSLTQQQNEINENITKVGRLKSRAEENSPALITLTEQEETLQQKLNENLQEMNFYVNNFKLW